MTSNEKEAYQRVIAASAPNLVPQQLRYELGVQDTSAQERSAPSGEATPPAEGLTDERWLEQYLPHAVLSYARAHDLYLDAG